MPQKPQNVYVKPMSWAGELRFYVGYQPSNPNEHPCHRLGQYFIQVDNLRTATCIADAEAKRIGGNVIVCDHFVGLERRIA